MVAQRIMISNSLLCFFVTVVFDLEEGNAVFHLFLRFYVFAYLFILERAQERGEGQRGREKERKRLCGECGARLGT